MTELGSHSSPPGCFHIPFFSPWKHQTQGETSPGASCHTAVLALPLSASQLSARVRGVKTKLDLNSHSAEGDGQGQDRVSSPACSADSRDFV